MIVGGGVAGLIAANRASASGLKVVVVEKATAGLAGQAIMSGGMAWVIGPDDDLDAWAKWQVARGDYLNDQWIVYALAQRSYSAYRELLAWGMPFACDSAGRLRLFHPPGFPAAHWMASFDHSTLTSRLRLRALEQGVTICNKTQIVELLQMDGRIVGAAGFDVLDGHGVLIQARAVILANGSCDFKVERLFGNSCGEGIAAAYRAGAEMRNAEFGNLYGPRFKEMDLTFRGALLAQLRNGEGENIFERYVAPDQAENLNHLIQGMAREVQAGRGPITLDFSRLPSDFDDSHRPSTEHPANPERLVSRLAGLGLVDGPCHEVVPGFMGKLSPVRVDAMYRATLPGLWAIGDVSHLGSAWEGAIPGGEVGGPCMAYAIISGLDGGATAAAFAAESPPVALDDDQIHQAEAVIFAPLHRSNGITPNQVLDGARSLACALPFSLFRSHSSLNTALGRLARLQEQAVDLKAADSHDLLKCHEASSLIVCLEMALRAALLRTESRGAHLREDHPHQDDEKWLCWITLCQRDGQMVLATERLPIEKYPFQPWSRPTPWAREYATTPRLSGTPQGGQSLNIDVTALRFLDLQDRPVGLGNFRGQALILTASGRPAVSEVARWNDALARAFAGRPEIRLFRAVMVSRLPFFVPRGVIKNELKKAPGPAPFLIDWEDDPASPLRLSDQETPHVFLVDTHGRLVWKLLGCHSELAMSALERRVNQLVE